MSKDITHSLIYDESEKHLADAQKNGTNEFFKETTGEDLLNHRSEKIATLVDPFLPKVGIVCLGGGSDTGKSCILRQLVPGIGVETFLSFANLSSHPKTHQQSNL